MFLSIPRLTQPDKGNCRPRYYLPSVLHAKGFMRNPISHLVADGIVSQGGKEVKLFFAAKPKACVAFCRPKKQQLFGQVNLEFYFSKNLKTWFPNNGYHQPRSRRSIIGNSVSSNPRILSLNPGFVVKVSCL